MTATGSAIVIVTQASPETKATLYAANRLLNNCFVKNADLGRRLRMYNNTCNLRVKIQVLQVSNKGQCFMLATELHLPCGPNVDAGRSGGPSFDFHTSCLLHVLLTDTQERDLLSSNTIGV